MDKPEDSPFKDQMVGRVFMGRYRLVRRLAAGGMGVVYLARSEGAEGFVKPVVVKLIHPHFETVDQFSSMFIREAQIMSNLQHAGIVNVIDFAKEGHVHVMVLEYVNGYQMKQWAKYRRFKKNPLPVNVIVQLIIGTLDALHYAHTLKRPDGELMGIVHRDISSANILVDSSGMPKLLDFGIAFVAQGTEELATRNTGFKGKLPYSAPELFAGNVATVASDVYACAVVLHELILGRNDFASRTEGEIIDKVVNKTPTFVTTVRPEAPPILDDIIQKALAKKPEDRYTAASEFRKALHGIYSTEEQQQCIELVSDSAQEDFGGEMAKFLGVESLSDRDRAWRNPSVVPQPSFEDAQAALADATAIAAAPTDPDAQTKLYPTADSEFDEDGVKRSALSRRVKSAIGIVALAASLIALGIVLFAEESKAPSEKPIFVVQSPVNEPDTLQNALKDTATETAPPTDTAPDTSSGTAEQNEPQISEDKPQKKPSKSRNKKNKSQNLGAAFRKQKGEVKSCFNRHEMNMDGQPKIFVNFELDKGGKVQAASLTPASLSGTSLGACLLGVAKRTRFASPGQPIAFRIPVTTWRSDAK